MEEEYEELFIEVEEPAVTEETKEMYFIGDVVVEFQESAENPEEKLKQTVVVAGNEWNNKLICDMCPSTFIKKQSIIRHIKVKHLDKRLTCDMCPKLFFRSIALIQHKITEHGGPTRHVCSFCDMKFDKAWKLKVHKKRHSMNVKKKKPIKEFSCTYCFKDFLTNSQKELHVNRVHLNIRNFHCTFEDCKQAFFSNFLLKTHTLQHMKNKQQFQCSECLKVFLTNIRLARHKKMTHKIQFHLNRGRKSTGDS